MAAVIRLASLVNVRCQPLGRRTATGHPLDEAGFDFAREFERLAAEEQRGSKTDLGGVTVRLARVAGGGEGEWDSHADTTATVIAWSGDFTVAFRDRTLRLQPGRCCVVPQGAEQGGTSKPAANVIPFTQT